jgi:RNA polymerase sigma-70 factor (ECF subfamily)
MPPANDARILDKLRADDSSALEALFREHYGPLCGFVSRHTASDVAEELVQETFMQLWRDRATVSIHTSLRAYLYASARNRALNHLERQGVERRWSESETLRLTHASAEPDAERTLESAEVSARVRNTVAELPARLRETVELRWGRQWSHAEIAEAMGISVKGVEANVARAKAMLRASLQDLIE